MPTTCRQAPIRDAFCGWWCQLHALLHRLYLHRCIFIAVSLIASGSENDAQQIAFVTSAVGQIVFG
eukprot:1526324-Pyramimonas_sp.AAC.1